MPVDDIGSEYFDTSASAILRPATICRTGSPTPPARRSGRRIGEAVFTCRPMPTIAPPRSSATPSAPTRGGAVVFEEAIPAYFVGVGETQARQVHALIDSRRPRHVGGACPPAYGARRHAPPLAPRRTGVRYEVASSSGGAVLHPHQCRRCRGLQDGDRAGRDPRTRALARARSAPATAGCPRRHAYCDWLMRLEREGGLPRIVVRELARAVTSTGSTSTRRPTRWHDGRPRVRRHALRFIYSSMTTPAASTTMTWRRVSACSARRTRCRLRP